MVNPGLQSFDKLIDGWILDHLRNGDVTFDKLLISLPGVYPSEVVNSIDRLMRTDAIPELLAAAARGRFTPTVHARSSSNRSGPEIPIEHPLDYDWRFHSLAVDRLLKLTFELTTPGEAVVMLGVPSVLVAACETKFPRPFAIIDSNARVNAYLSKTCSPGCVYHRSISDELPQITAGAVIVDPPWYVDYMRAFLWAASSLCKAGGHVLFSAPLIGTRPNIVAELEELLEWSESQLGLKVVGKRDTHLAYLTPFFEHNSLRAAGLHNLPDWRRADLLVLRRSGELLAARPKLRSSPEQEFSIEGEIDGVRIRARSQENSSEWGNPALISIIEGDILQSVSRRDERRKLADVWTSGNRIFACEGKALLACILHSLGTNRVPEREAASLLGRELSQTELGLVAKAISQLKQIVSIERNEVLAYRGGIERNGSAIPANC
jgi:hypothetical protein